MFVVREEDELALYARPPWITVGDLLMATPAIAEFRRMNPTTRIAVYCDHWQSHALHKNHDVTRCITSSIKIPREIRKADAGWDMHKHPVLQMMRKLGVEDSPKIDKRIRIYSDEEDSRVIENYLSIYDNKPFAVIALHNSWMIRGDVVTEIIKCVRDADLIPLVIGQAAGAYTTLNRRLGPVLVNEAISCWRITHVKELIAKARLFIGMDSGSAQIAAATSTDMIVVFSNNIPQSREPLRQSGKFIPVAPHVCYCRLNPCQNPTFDMVPNCSCEETLACVHSISPSDISVAFEKLWHGA